MHTHTFMHARMSPHSSCPACAYPYSLVKYRLNIFSHTNETYWSDVSAYSFYSYGYYVTFTFVSAELIHYIPLISLQTIMFVCTYFSVCMFFGRSVSVLISLYLLLAPFSLTLLRKQIIVTNSMANESDQQQNLPRMLFG